MEGVAGRGAKNIEWRVVRQRLNSSNARDREVPSLARKKEKLVVSRPPKRLRGGGGPPTPLMRGGSRQPVYLEPSNQSRSTKERKLTHERVEKTGKNPFPQPTTSETKKRSQGRAKTGLGKKT